MGACNQCINEKREDGGVILDSKRATIRLQAINIEKQKVQAICKGYIDRKIYQTNASQFGPQSIMSTTQSNCSQRAFKYEQPSPPGAVMKPGQLLENGNVYEGEWCGDAIEGKGIMYHSNGGLSEGYWRNGKLHGKGRQTFPSGDVYSGEWFDGVMHGQGKLKNKLNNNVYKGEWKFGQQDGFGIEIWPDGSVYEGQFSKGLKHGQGKFNWSNGCIYEGQFECNFVQGFGTYQWQDGKIYRGQWLANKMNGKGLFKWPDGRWYEGEYKDNKKQGKGVFHWPEGKSYEGDWYNGLQHGEGVVYYPNNRSMHCRWENGKKIKTDRQLICQMENYNVDLSKVIEVLQDTKRSSQDVLLLLQNTAHIQFFKKLKEETAEEAHFQCCQKMEYQFTPQDHYLFRIGDSGDKFYIIISGQVGIRVLLDQKDEETQETIKMETQVAVLGNGASFGELALIKDQPRAASIYCLTDCHFATLDKASYIRILGKIQAKQLDELVDFIHGLPPFQKRMRREIEKLTYYFKQQSYNRNQYIFRQGEPADSIIIVRSGEVQLSQRLRFAQESELKISQKGKLRVETSQEKQPKRLIAQRAIMGVGSIIGDEDIVNDSSRSTDCKCFSENAAILKISKIDFIRRIRHADFYDYIDRKKEIQGNLEQGRVYYYRNLFAFSNQGSNITPQPIKQRPIVQPLTQRLLKESNSLLKYRKQPVQTQSQRLRDTTSNVQYLEKQFYTKNIPRIRKLSERQFTRSSPILIKSYQQRTNSTQRNNLNKSPILERIQNPPQTDNFAFIEVGSFIAYHSKLNDYKQTRKLAKRLAQYKMEDWEQWEDIDDEKLEKVIQQGDKFQDEDQTEQAPPGQANQPPPPQPKKKSKKQTRKQKIAEFEEKQKQERQQGRIDPKEARQMEEKADHEITEDLFEARTVTELRTEQDYLDYAGEVARRLTHGFSNQQLHKFFMELMRDAKDLLNADQLHEISTTINVLHRDKVRSIKGPVKKKANKKPQLKGINKRGEAFGDPLGDDPIGDDDFNEYDDFI